MTQMTQSTMRAAAIDEFGGPITPHMLPVPEVGPDEILIRVESAGVGVWDTFEREGGFAKLFGTRAQFPYVLGSDGAGTVVDVGENVSGFKKGDRVYAMALANPKGGFYAQYAAVKARDASLIPGKLTVEQAGVLPVDAITALRGLDDTLGLKRGESVLIFGASGGIGHLAVQFAKRMGARVFAVASGDDGVALAKRLGANAVVDGHTDDVIVAARRFAPAGLDAALLTAGGKAAERALEAVRDGGRVAYPNGVEPEPRPGRGITARSYDGTPDPAAIEKLNRLIETEPFEVHVARTFPLDQAAEAHRALDEHFLGKMALRPELTTMNTTDAIFHRALCKLLTEIFDGPPGDEAYVLNPGDAGLLRQLDPIKAGAASTRPMPGKTTIAAHVDHVRYGLSLLNRWATGEANPWASADWEASWRHTVVSDDQWRTLRDNLRREAEAWQKHVTVRTDWDDLAAAGALASAAHTAYHLGAIRQILAAHQG